MARLPEIETAPVQDTSGAHLQLSSDARRFADTMQAGLQAIGHEIARTEAQRGEVKLATALNDTEEMIDANKQVSTAWLREKLGPDFDSISPEIKKRITQKNPITGADEDRQDIPMWQVAGSIYDAKSRRAIADATGEISGDGWKSEFSDKAALEIQRRKMEIGRKQLHAMGSDLAAQHIQDAMDAANAGNFELAYQVVATSPWLPKAAKLKADEEVAKIQESKPIFDADRTDDYGKMAELIGKLNDPAEFTHLDPKERDAYSTKLKARIKEFQANARTEEERRKKAYDDSIAMGVYQASVAGQRLSAKMLPLDMNDPDKYKSLAEYIEKKNKGEEPKTNYRLFAALYERIKNGEEVMLTDHLTELSGADFKQLLEMQIGKKSGAGFDKFQTTDEAINTQLRGYGYNPADTKDSKLQEKVGYLKSIVQHEMAAAQGAKPGSPELSLEERDALITRVLKREIDPKSGMLSRTSVPTHKLGVPAQIVPTFRRAVAALAPVLKFGDPNSEQVLEMAYSDYRVYEPEIEIAWNVQRGANILPSDTVRVWYYLNANMARLRGRLVETGGGTADKTVERKRLVHMAVQEMINTRR